MIINIGVTVGDILLIRKKNIEIGQSMITFLETNEWTIWRTGFLM